jgi:hypothetical protein
MYYVIRIQSKKRITKIWDAKACSVFTTNAFII